MAERLTGTIARVAHYTEDSGWGVVRVERESGGVIDVVGVMTRFDEGDDIEAFGRWEDSPRWGRQFRSDDVRPVLPVTREGVLRFLSSGRVKGVGKGIAQRIVDAFGDDTIRILDEEPQRLRTIAGIGAAKQQTIARSWTEQRDMRGLLIMLAPHGIGAGRVATIHKKYGGAAATEIRRNPYQLTEIRGIGFTIADKIGQAVGVERDSPLRIAAGVFHALEQARRDGHCGLPHETLLTEATKLLGVDAEAVERAIAIAVEARKLVAADGLVFTRRLFECESFVAAKLRRLASERHDWNVNVAALDLELTDEKYRAIETVLGAGVAVITGGPGVGKTTVVKAILAILDELELEVELVAPTGRAAKRLSESAGRPARTIHRLLEWNPIENGFQRNEEKPLECDLVVVDEASMVDVVLLESLLDAIDPGTALLFVGDEDQLPSIGPGQVLADIIASGAVPVARLKQVFRQHADSAIVMNAHRINEGKMPELKGKTQFTYFRAESPEDAERWIVDIVTSRIPQKFGLDPLRDVQVLAPMKSRVAGTEALNLALQRQLNPRSSGSGFAIGDKVMQTQNNYDKDVFNGDIGFIRDVDEDNDIVEVEFEASVVKYEGDEIEQLTLAYATTIHKSQGSEFPAVVVPLLTGHHIMLQRNLLYTAVTRAKELVVLVGQEHAIRTAVRTEARRRHTRLRGLLAGRQASAVSDAPAQTPADR